MKTLSIDTKKYVSTLRQLGLGSCSVDELTKSITFKATQALARTGLRILATEVEIHEQCRNNNDTNNEWVDVKSGIDIKHNTFEFSTLVRLTTQCEMASHVVIICSSQENAIALEYGNTIWLNYPNTATLINNRYYLQRIHAYGQGIPYILFPGTVVAPWHRDLPYHERCGRLVRIRLED